MNYLDQFNTGYKKAQPPESKSVVPDDNYQTEVVTCKIGPTKFDQNILNMYWELNILSGDYVGQLIKKWATIQEDRMPYIKKDIELCEVVLEKFSDVEDRLGEFIGLRLEVTVKSKPKKSGEGTYTNVYFNKLLNGKGDGDTATSQQCPEYDDVPF